jgi:NADPH:quinone reductase-like Zn-dependent oxidoreductase
MTSHNLALHIPAAKSAFQVGPAEIYQPGPHDLLIKNTSLALNPLEYKIQKLGILTRQYPSISGFSFAGTVEKIGSSVTAFQVGDRIVALKKFSEPNSGNQYGAFQKYVLIQDTAAAKLDESTTLDEASSVISNLIATVGALNMSMAMDRAPVPNSTVMATTKPRKNQKILIYGGSSVFGMLASEYAMQAGYDVVTTSSPRNVGEVRQFCPSAQIVHHTLPKEEVIERLSLLSPSTTESR